MRADLPRPFAPVVLAAAAVTAQLAYPLTHGRQRDAVTVAIVLLFAGSSATHAVLTRGARGAASLLVTAAGGFGVEVLGVHTGFPFGRYEYSGTLGPRLWGVPLLVAAAWTMLAWPAALVARRLVGSRAGRIVVGGWALASWDLFLDPQMVADGHWTWRHPSPHLPGVTAVPASNYAGWLAVALLISLVLQAILGSSDGPDAVPVLLYLWTYVGSVVAFAAFLDLRAAAAWGALGMGLVALPLLRAVTLRGPIRATS
jgi:putative membrane protein